MMLASKIRDQFRNMARKKFQQFVNNSTEKSTKEKCLKPKKQTKSEKEKWQQNISQYICKQS